MFDEQKPVDARPAVCPMHAQPDPLACAQALVAGYHRGLKLNAAEIDVELCAAPKGS